VLDPQDCLERANLLIWARALSETLPQTTAAMLELDYLYRTTPQFSALERGLIRLFNISS